MGTNKAPLQIVDNRLYKVTEVCNDRGELSYSLQRLNGITMTPLKQRPVVVPGIRLNLRKVVVYWPSGSRTHNHAVTCKDERHSVPDMYESFTVHNHIPYVFIVHHGQKVSIPLAGLIVKFQPKGERETVEIKNMIARVYRRVRRLEKKSRGL